jgi:phosphoglucan,water dikinase
VKLRLRLDHQVNFGEHHALLGSAEAAGAWNNKVTMGWTEAGWVADLEANPGETIEYKYLIVNGDGHTIWENGGNRTIVVPNDSGSHYQVVSHWDATHEEVHFDGLNGAAISHGEDSVGEEQAGGVEESEGNENGSAAPEPEQKEEVGSSFVQGWQGREISFMRSNDHSHEKSGKWDTTGLDAPATHIVEGDHNSANWWRKVSLIAFLSSQIATHCRQVCRQSTP